MLAQYKLYIYAAVAILIMALCGSTYFFYANNKNKALQIEQLSKESKFWQDTALQIQASHNDYVGKLRVIQKAKQKIQYEYNRKVEEIENEKIDTITEPLVIIPAGMSAFSSYSADRR